MKDLYHLPTKDSLDGKHNSYENALLQQPKYHPKSMQALTAEYKQQIMAHAPNMQQLTVVACPPGNHKKKINRVKAFEMSILCIGLAFLHQLGLKF